MSAPLYKIDKRLEPFALAIGEMCNEWAHLESWIRRLFMVLGSWDYRFPGALAMADCISFRDALEGAKVGAHIRAPADLLEMVLSSLNFIDSDLRTARNRFVHDIWSIDDDGISARKFETGPKMGRIAASGKRIIQQFTINRVIIEELHDVILDIIDERAFVAELLIIFMKPLTVGSPEPLSKQPKRRLLLRLAEKQRQKEPTSPKQKPPPKPSAASRRKQALEKKT